MSDALDRLRGEKPIKLKITSDGHTTLITDAVTGRRIQGITSIQYNAPMWDDATLKIEVVNPEAIIEGKLIKTNVESKNKKISARSEDPYEVPF